MSEQKPFLSHVNGMRALAILAIFVYHLNASYCPAGYFGVDVFLVISGYFLLVSLMRAERPGDIHYGTWLLKKSWRILPSWLLVTVVFCLGSAAFMIAPDRVEICNTAFRSGYFGADYYIDHLYDYFNQKAHQNLFLHYWYLSITCQMYIVIPLLLMLLLRLCSKKTTVIVLGGVGVLSLVFYVLATTLQVPEGLRLALLKATGMVTAYYHLLPRLWEVLLGGAVLLLPAWQEQRRLRILLETLAAAAMLFSFFYFETGFSQVYLAACSALLFIRYGGAGPVSRLLSWRPVQWLGTISFSLYLWHWPVMAAWKYVNLDEITGWDECGMVAVSLLLGALSWRFVECLKTPKSPGRVATFLRYAPLLLLAFFLCGIRPYYKAIKRSADVGLTGQGLIKEQTDDMRAAPDDADLLQGFDAKPYDYTLGYIGSESKVAPSFLLLGDSHAVHSFHGMNLYCNEHGLRGTVMKSGVFPFWWCYKENTWNEKRAEAFMTYLEQQPSIRYVFIALLWQNRLCGSAKDNGGPTLDWREMKRLDTEEQIALRIAGLEETCRRLTAMGKRVVFLADVPLLPPNLSPWQLSQKSKMLKGIDAPEYLTPVAVHKRDAARYTEALMQIRDKGYARAIIDCAEPLRQGEVYRTRNDEGQFLYTDNNHLTYVGSELVARYIMAEWERIVREDE